MEGLYKIFKNVQKLNNKKNQNVVQEFSVFFSKLMKSFGNYVNHQLVIRAQLVVSIRDHIQRSKDFASPSSGRNKLVTF